MLIYVVVIACFTCCGAVYNLCLVLLLYMLFAFNNNNPRHHHHNITENALQAAAELVKWHNKIDTNQGTYVVLSIVHI